MSDEMIEGFKACIVQETLKHRSPGGAAALAVQSFCKQVVLHRDRYFAKQGLDNAVRREIADIADAACERARHDGLKIYLPETAA